MFDVYDNRGFMFDVFHCPRASCPWKQGIAAGLQRSRQLGVPCDYFFTMDDDIEWTIAPAFSDVLQMSDDIDVAAADSSHAATHFPDHHYDTDLTKELAFVLSSWTPAVAAFGSKIEESSYDGAKAVAALYKDDRVAPLTSVDSGNVLYHASIIDFVIPMAPNGEGGFSGNWTLPGAWLNMYLPLLFKSNAICINSIAYNDVISSKARPRPSPTTPYQGRQRVRRDSKLLSEPSQVDGVVFFSTAARHPTDEHVRGEYEAFLRSSLKVMSWGPAMQPTDVDWRPENGAPPFTASVFARVTSVVDATHPGIAPYLQRISSVMSPSFRIVLMAHRGRAMLESCLQSLRRALYGSRYSIALDVHSFYKTQEDQAYISEAVLNPDLAWSKGPVRFVQHPADDATQDLAAFASVPKDLWLPSQFSEFAIFMDDSVEVCVRV